MKRIPRSNAAAIEAALATVNGNASAHCYTTADELIYLADAAEKQLAGLGIAKARRAVNNSYARKAMRRGATHVDLIRRASGWALVDVQRVEIWQNGGGTLLCLTPAQDAEAVAATRAQYRVLPAQENDHV